VVAFARFPSEALDEHADVVFPAEIYPEKEGTVTHPDGRLQRVRQALGHAGDVRPAWRVLHDLCERLGVGLGALTAPMVTERLADAVPLYAGITLEEIGGLGVRWQEREAAPALPAEELSPEPLSVPPAPDRGLRLASAPTLWTGPEVEYSPALRFLSTRARAEISVEDAREAGVENGDDVRLTSNGAVIDAVATVRSAVPAGSVFVTGASVPVGPVELSSTRHPVAAS
jgi:NADH-quinone oxidoreductase subunit G